ncbi:hypothetical protein P7K49_014206 [Saguinus oedipus]|uniref:Uncharacterized protein n=1 Tax=Saguinus oedipus TaxID=9490 RepID=A0ABQ9VIS3_SAGOE|nr:hypothetical protein P7K49_014206 [Saguinus oedipus]
MEANIAGLKRGRPSLDIQAEKFNCFKEIYCSFEKYELKIKASDPSEDAVYLSLSGSKEDEMLPGNTYCYTRRKRQPQYPKSPVPIALKDSWSTSAHLSKPPPSE